MTKLMEEEYTSTWMELSIRESGEKTSSMGMGLKHGQMVLGTMGITNMGRNMEQGLLSGLTTHNTLESFITIIFMGRECILGVMAGNMKENGEIIKCMEKEPSHGQMEGSM